MLITTQEYAKRKNMKLKTIQALIRRGNLKAQSFGRFYLIEEDEPINYKRVRKVNTTRA